MNNFSPLKATEHMLHWLSDNPYEEIIKEVTAILQEQVEGSKLLSFNVCSEPQWLTGGKKKEDEKKMILVRTGLAFEFSLEVKEPAGLVHQLSGVYSWVGQNLDKSNDFKQRVWFDIDGTLDSLGSDGVLRERMYFE